VGKQLRDKRAKANATDDHFATINKDKKEEFTF